MAGGALAAAEGLGAGVAGVALAAEPVADDDFADVDVLAGAGEASDEVLSFFFRDDDFCEEALSAAGAVEASADAASALELFLEDFLVDVESAVAVESDEGWVSFAPFLEDDFLVVVEAVSEDEVALSEEAASAFLDFLDFFVAEVDD